MEWSQCTVSGRAMAEFASRYPKPHMHLLIEAVTAEKKENILPPGFEDTAREAAARLERGDQDIDKAMDEVLAGLTTMSATELAVSTLGNLCVAGQVLPAFKEQIAPFCQDIVAALARQLRPMDWRLCGRAAGGGHRLQNISEARREDRGHSVREPRLEKGHDPRGADHTAALEQALREG